MEAACIHKQPQTGGVASVKQCLVDSGVTHASNYQLLPEKPLIKEEEGKKRKTPKEKKETVKKKKRLRP